MVILTFGENFKYLGLSIFELKFIYENSSMYQWKSNILNILNSNAHKKIMLLFGCFIYSRNISKSLLSKCLILLK